MKLYLCFMAFTAFIVLAAGQDNEETTYPASEASEVCSLNKLIDEKCTKEDDIPCRRCYFKACHNPGPFNFFNLLLATRFPPLVF